MQRPYLSDPSFCWSFISTASLALSREGRSKPVLALVSIFEEPLSFLTSFQRLHLSATGHEGSSWIEELKVNMNEATTSLKTEDLISTTSLLSPKGVLKKLHLCTQCRAVLATSSLRSIAACSQICLSLFQLDRTLDLHMANLVQTKYAGMSRFFFDLCLPQRASTSSGNF